MKITLAKGIRYMTNLAPEIRKMRYAKWRRDELMEEKDIALVEQACPPSADILPKPVEVPVEISKKCSCCCGKKTEVPHGNPV